MNKKNISFVLALALSISCIGANAFADPYNEKAEYEQKLQEDTNSYKSAQEQVDEIEASIQSVNSEMEIITMDINELNAEILEVEGRIKESNKKVQATQDDIDEESDLFSKRMRAMYINGMDSYIEVLLNSKSLSDFISRLDNVSKIINNDKEIQSSLAEKKEILVSEKRIIEEEKVALDVLQDENNQKLAQLEVKKAEHTVAVEKAKSNAELFAAAMKESQAKIDEAMRQVSAASGGSTSRPSRGGSVSYASGSSIVDSAVRFIGTPYQWGGNGPSSFDCSGFVKYVYAENGISLARVAQSQMNGGSYVDRGSLQPGDLVFFGSAGNVYHVGIYVGNDCYIHAPQDNDVVKISSLSRSDYFSARRY